MTTLQQQLAARDLKVIWHPCTQMHDHEQVPLIPIRQGQGVWLEDYDGKRYLDAISSWWVNLFGHSHPHINQALKEQVDKLSHVIFAGFSHEPAILFAEKLTQLAPPGLTRCFFADNGSTAIESALKMSFHYWHNIGKTQKKRFVHLSNSYHGETLGALAVGDVAIFKKTYAPLLIEAIRVPSPDCYYREPGESWEDCSRRMFAEMEQTLAMHGEEISAVIVEPLVQCAGGMRMYHPIYLSLLRKACDKYGVHLIADEVAVGFGRTGTLFACEQADISPDFLCLSKGITGGYLPLSVVLTSEDIYQAFFVEYQQQKAFLHSHSYSGNTLACRAALATLEIFSNEPILDHNQHLIQHLHQQTQIFVDHPHIAEVRQTGMIVAMEMVKDKTTREPYDWRERRGLQIAQKALAQGLLIRPLGNVIYFMPPYVITKDEINYLVEKTYEVLEQVCNEKD
jgi:adenosylmethionine-8-amino-7-oxononanoate aminotransferase